MRSLLPFILEYSQSAYLRLHLIFTHVHDVHMGISDIFEQCNANCNLWTCIRKLFKTFSVDNLR